MLEGEDRDDDTSLRKLFIEGGASLPHLIGVGRRREMELEMNDAPTYSFGTFNEERRVFPIKALRGDSVIVSG